MSWMPRLAGSQFPFAQGRLGRQHAWPANAHRAWELVELIRTRTGKGRRSAQARGVIKFERPREIVSGLMANKPYEVRGWLDLDQLNAFVFVGVC